MALKYHPDKNKNNLQYEEKFKEISTAYNDILKSGYKASTYDTYFEYSNITGNFTDIFINGQSI